MSIIGNYLVLTTEELASVIEAPSRAGELAYPASGDLPAGSVDIDKAWH